MQWQIGHATFNVKCEGSMPIYEFLCPECNRIFSFFSKSLKETRIPHCPRCKSDHMIRQISLVSPLRTKKGRHNVADSASDAEGDVPRSHDPEEDAKMEKAMKVLEREMAGMDEENPDPRQLGRLMRRMSEMTGEPMPEELHEAVKRLEAGEDPEKIEEEMGDLFGEGEYGDDSGYGCGPTRDPGLYDL